jgi:hypothetical protein
MRTTWFVAGTAAGVSLSARARRAAESLTVDGIHDRLTGWFAGAAVLREELRAGVQEKEQELRERLQLEPPARPALTDGSDRPGHVAPVHRLHPGPDAAAR